MNRKNKQQHHPRGKCRWLFEMTNEREQSQACLGYAEGEKQELSYDPWGRLRNPATQQVYAVGSEPTLFLGRGYTGHEHLTAFGLINMNARLYDPAVGRFLSPDPYVQAPDFTQNFNRYSYCLNNPLRYTDPSGEFIGTIVTAVLGFAKAVVKGVVIPWFVGFDDPLKAGQMFSNA